MRFLFLKKILFCIGLQSERNFHGKKPLMRMMTSHILTNVIGDLMRKLGDFMTNTLRRFEKISSGVPRKYYSFNISLFLYLIGDN